MPGVILTSPSASCIATTRTSSAAVSLSPAVDPRVMKSLPWSAHAAALLCFFFCVRAGDLSGRSCVSAAPSPRRCCPPLRASSRCSSSSIPPVAGGLPTTDILRTRGLGLGVATIGWPRARARATVVEITIYRGVHKCVVGIACYGSRAVSAQLSEQCVRRTASQRERGLTALPAQKCGQTAIGGKSEAKRRLECLHFEKTAAPQGVM